MRSILLLSCMLFGQYVLSQNANYYKNVQALESIKEGLFESRIQKENRISEFVKKNKHLKRSFSEGFNEYSIIDVVDGQAQYYTTLNDSSALCLGVHELRPGGSLNMDLGGDLINMAVWDRGLPLSSHSEYQNRVLNNDAASEFSYHSTHVTGTLLAGGLNPKAKGMSYRAMARAYDWFQDTEEIVDDILQHDLMISNHSYSLLGGWEGGTWYGNLAISDKEDYRFGYYSLDAKTMDDIHYNAPYYTLVCAAGNDRGNSGDGSIPPDGPYDIIIGFATGKNVLTIGAVHKFSDGYYEGPEDVQMSSFSSWGPTDDGRIKPDLVAPGVDLLSCSNNSDFSYGYSSGTSMASPSAAGALALVSEAYFLLNGTYMRSASLKALAIHSARESGTDPGPDYEFGWGMLDVAEAVDFIRSIDGVNKTIIEGSLVESQEFEMDLNPKPGKKIKATLVWTDPSGNVPPASLDPSDLILVNDLDMVIEDISNNTQLPWILDPSVPFNPATRGDNFRDNVEKIEFDSPEARPYTLNISHKGTLSSGMQDFSLILEYESEDAGIKNLYWVNGEGTWSDGMMWSESSGGVGIDQIPDTNSKIIIDDNSVSENGTVITVDQDFSISGLVAFSDKEIILELGGNSLTLSGSTIMASENFTIRNGTLIFLNEEQADRNLINLSDSNFENVEFRIDEQNKAEWYIENNKIEIQNFKCLGGSLSLHNTHIGSDTIHLASELELNDCSFSPNDELELIEGMLLMQTGTNSITVKDSDSCFLNLNDVENDFSVSSESSSVILKSDVLINELSVINSELRFLNNADIDLLEMSEGSTMTLDPSSLVNCRDVKLNSSTDMRIRFYCLDSQAKASFGISQRDKYCFDHLDIENIDLSGPAAVSVGENSTLINSDNWLSVPCDDLLFTDFSSEFLCEGGMGLFTDLSQGNVVGRRWMVNGSEAWGDSTMEFYFESMGEFNIELEVTDPNGNTDSWSQVVTVTSSEILDNRIIQNQTQLASLNLAETYQWYNYGVAIPGETERVYLYNGAAGIYFVVTYEGDCNRRSDILDLGTNVTNLDETSTSNVRIYSSIGSDKIGIEYLESQDYSQLSLYDLSGRLVQKAFYRDVHGIKNLNIAELNNGSYILIIENGDNVFSKRIVKLD